MNAHQAIHQAELEEVQQTHSTVQCVPAVTRPTPDPRQEKLASLKKEAHANPEYRSRKRDIEAMERRLDELEAEYNDLQYQIGAAWADLESQVKLWCVEQLRKEEGPLPACPRCGGDGCSADGTCAACIPDAEPAEAEGEAA